MLCEQRTEENQSSLAMKASLTYLDQMENKFVIQLMSTKPSIPHYVNIYKSIYMKILAEQSFFAISFREYDQVIIFPIS